MRSRKEVIIDGIKYDVGPISPTKSIKLMTKITKILGPSLVKLLKDGFDSKKKIEDIDLKAMNLDGMFSEFFDRLDEDELMGVMITILSNTLHHGGGNVNGFGSIDSGKFDTVFADSGILHAFKVVKEAVSVTYSDFFAENGGLLSKLKGAVVRGQNTK